MKSQTNKQMELLPNYSLNYQFEYPDDCFDNFNDEDQNCINCEAFSYCKNNYRLSGLCRQSWRDSCSSCPHHLITSNGNCPSGNTCTSV